MDDIRFGMLCLFSEILLLTHLFPILLGLSLYLIFYVQVANKSFNGDGGVVLRQQHNVSPQSNTNCNFLLHLFLPCNPQSWI